MSYVFLALIVVPAIAAHWLATAARRRSDRNGFPQTGAYLIGIGDGFAIGWVVSAILLLAVSAWFFG